MSPKPIEDNGWSTVVAFDPGGTTGWSVMCVYPDALTDPDVSILKSIIHWRHGQISGTEHSNINQILELVAMWPGAAVVCESFVIRKFIQSPEFLSPVRIRAVLEWALRRGYDGLDEFDHPVRQLFTQAPAHAMGLATDTRLKAWGLYERDGGMEHARDADRHAITFLRRAKEEPTLRWRAWPQYYAQDGSLLTDAPVREVGSESA